MMLYIIIVTYIKPLEEIDRFLLDHRAFLETYYIKGQFIASGPLNPRTGGILISMGTSKQELLNIFSNDPFHIHGIATYEVMEFNPVKYQEAFKPFIDGL